MREYPKIQSVYKRDPDNRYRTFLDGEWSTPEFEYLADSPWLATEKIDGTNMRLEVGLTKFLVGGRTERAQIPARLNEHMYELGKNLITHGGLAGLTLFGEGYGAGIQKGGGDYRSDQGFILFDVQVTDTGLWLERENVIDIGSKFGILVVAATRAPTLRLFVGRFRSEVEAGDPPVSYAGNRSVEGYVLRPIVELQDRMGGRIITKVKVKDFQ